MKIISSGGKMKETRFGGLVKVIPLSTVHSEYTASATQSLSYQGYQSYHKIKHISNHQEIRVVEGVIEGGL